MALAEQPLRTLTLPREDYVLLNTVLEAWLEGYGDAKEQTIEDHSIDEPEDLLALMHGLDTEFSRLTRIKDRVWNLASR